MGAVSIGGETLRETLGEKHKPYSMGDAVRETNPNYNYRYDEYSKNCQRCVVAYELRRRGYDVTARNRFKTGEDKWPQIAHIDRKKGTYEGRWKGAFKNAKTVNVSARTEKGVIGNIEKQLAKAGNGSRGVVQILYKNGGGHVFNVENNNGKIQYVEAQAGRMKNINTTMSRVKLDRVMFVRTDNLRISDRAKEFVTKTNKRRGR